MKNKYFSAKNCVFSGGAQGIGRALVLEFAKRGTNLLISDIDMDKLENVKKEAEAFGVKVYTTKCDISKDQDFIELEKLAYSKFDHVDFLVNNAGIGGGGFIEDLDVIEWKRILDINLWGIIRSVYAFLPKMLERGSGHIINTGSGAGIVGLPCHIHYVTTKFAISGLTEALYSELSHKGLNFSVICPTVIKSNIMDKTSFKLPLKSIDEKDIAGLDMNQTLFDFKKVFWEKYSDGGYTPEQAAKKYIKRIKKKKLYVFDKKLLPIALFIKGISRSRIYSKLLRGQGIKDFDIIDESLTELGIKHKHFLDK